MAEYGDLRGPLEKIIQLNKEMARHLRCLSCGGDAAESTAGTSDVPAGLTSFSLVKTSSDADTVIITMTDGSTYTLTEEGEVFTTAANPGGKLPAYEISGAGTFKWQGLK